MAESQAGPAEGEPELVEVKPGGTLTAAAFNGVVAALRRIDERSRRIEALLEKIAGRGDSQG